MGRKKYIDKILKEKNPRYGLVLTFVQQCTDGEVKNVCSKKTLRNSIEKLECDSCGVEVTICSYCKSLLLNTKEFTDDLFYCNKECEGLNDIAPKIK